MAKYNNQEDGKMKKVVALILALIFVFSLAACGGTSGGSESESATEAKASTVESKTNDTTNGNNTSKDSKTLIVYFSWSNNTDKMANYIHDRIGGDMERIEPVDAYPEDYNETADKAKAERDNGARPKFKELQFNPEDYDTIFIGYPIWWYELPMIMRTFLDTYDLSGKTIVPFNTHEGSGDGGTYDQIKSEEPNATVLEGLPIRGGDIENADSKNKVNEWLSGLGY